MYHLSEAYLMASYISLLAIYLGALIFGTAAVAPIAVGSLAEDSAGIFLRRYWVTYHRFAVFGGLFSPVPLPLDRRSLRFLRATLCCW